ncbi:metallophosphoesterase family protein [Sphingobacterium deserti]|uniref:Metallophosphoesterase n=1 Tax=Sphingobacterium deserti TaxID=1229276 RepID=A0A0B8T5P5_9SPHI|nr:metallophosphoesterase [Sphingobacterium deserti]KGE13039.1 metallophosphoesterase [Sphingobacterium deserti]
MKENRVKSAVILKETVDDSHKFRPLPVATGSYPYRLRLDDVLDDAADAFQDKISFHMLGDTGSPRYSAFQAVVAHVLNGQSNRELHAENTPAFLYHLGDIVYNHGEASAYPDQFLKPYERYEAPIFAIAGNHDGDINPESKVPYKSLAAFMDVFCDTERRPIDFAGGTTRKSMIQPHVYWTLETPTARFIGLYPNTPKHGEIDAEQRDWFINELRHADTCRSEQAIIVCIHHAPFSADTNHGSSEKMIDFLESAFLEANARPDIVFSGHVHNYQRFSRSYTDGQTVPFIVAGAGGYVDLHSVATTDDDFVKEMPVTEGTVSLESFCEDRYGFLKVSVERAPEGLLLHGEYYILPETAEDLQRVEASLFDRFSVIINRKTHASQVVSAYTASLD